MNSTLATNNSNRFLTTGQLAGLCGVSFRTVIRWIKKGYLQANRLPGRGDHRIETSECIRFMQAHDMTVPAQLFDESKTILIVDNELPVAHSIERVLRKVGYETHIATDGFRAGMLLASLCPSLVTLDLKMPGMDGFEFLRQVRQSPTFCRTRVLVISGDEQSKLKKALFEGANDVLAKPFTNEALTEKVTALAERKRINRRVA